MNQKTPPSLLMIALAILLGGGISLLAIALIQQQAGQPFPVLVTISAAQMTEETKHPNGTLGVIFRLPRDGKQPPLPDGQWVVLEEGKPLPINVGARSMVDLHGHGRYCIRGRTVSFSSTDGSDPRLNGRSYGVVNSRPVPWLSWAGLLSVILLLVVPATHAPVLAVAHLLSFADRGFARLKRWRSTLVAAFWRFPSTFARAIRPLPNAPERIYSAADRLGRVFAILFLAALFTILAVRASERIGRLSAPPAYDDVVYLLSGQRMVNAFHDRGVAGIVDYLSKRGLHAPYSEFMAAGALAFTGGSVKGPYYGNFFIVVFYLGGIGWLLRKLPLLQFILWLILFLTPAIATMAVVEFRPDVLWAFVTGFTCVWIISEKRIFRHRFKPVLAGLLFALALLSKPTTFALTVLVVGSALASRAVIYFLARENSASRQATPGWIRGVILLIVTFSLVSAPYWIPRGDNVWHYFYTNSFGENKHLWADRAGMLESLGYYIIGRGAPSNLGSGGYILLGLFVLFTTLNVCTRTQRYRSLIILCALLGTLLVNATASMKGPFSGGVIYGITIFGLAYQISLSRDWRLFRVYPGVAAVLLLGACAIALAGYRWPLYGDLRTSEKAAHRRRAQATFLDFLSRAPSEPERILFLQSGPLTPQAIHLRGLVRNPSFEVAGGALASSVEEIMTLAKEFKWIVAQDPGVQGAVLRMPIEAIMDEAVETLQRHPNYKLIETLPASDNKSFYVFERKDDKASP